VSANAAECVATVRCECGSTELELRPGTVVPHLVCPDCPTAPLVAPQRPTLTLVKGGAS